MWPFMHCSRTSYSRPVYSPLLKMHRDMIHVPAGRDVLKSRRRRSTVRSASAAGLDGMPESPAVAGDAPSACACVSRVAGVTAAVCPPVNRPIRGHIQLLRHPALHCECARRAIPSNSMDEPKPGELAFGRMGRRCSHQHAPGAVLGGARPPRPAGPQAATPRS
jgi:hypothetical protein